MAELHVLSSPHFIRIVCVCVVRSAAAGLLAITSAEERAGIQFENRFREFTVVSQHRGQPREAGNTLRIECEEHSVVGGGTGL